MYIYQISNFTNSTHNTPHTYTHRRHTRATERFVSCTKHRFVWIEKRRKTQFRKIWIYSSSHNHTMSSNNVRVKAKPHTTDQSGIYCYFVRAATSRLLLERFLICKPKNKASISHTYTVPIFCPVHTVMVIINFTAKQKTDLNPSVPYLLGQSAKKRNNRKTLSLGFFWNRKQVQCCFERCLGFILHMRNILY